MIKAKLGHTADSESQKSLLTELQNYADSPFSGGSAGPQLPADMGCCPGKTYSREEQRRTPVPCRQALTQEKRGEKMSLNQTYPDYESVSHSTFCGQNK